MTLGVWQARFDRRGTGRWTRIQFSIYSSRGTNRTTSARRTRLQGLKRTVFSHGIPSISNAALTNISVPIGRHASSKSNLALW